MIHLGRGSFRVAAGCVLFAWSTVVCGATDDDQPTSAAAFFDALDKVDSAEQELVLIPGLLEGLEPERETQQASFEVEVLVDDDPGRLKIDRSRLAPEIERATSTSSALHASLNGVVGLRIDDDVYVGADKLDSGTQGGGRVRVAYRFDDIGGINAWDIIGFGLTGTSSLTVNAPVFDPDSYHREASLVSVESNLIRRHAYKDRVRNQFLGLRYFDNQDSLERRPFYHHFFPSDFQETVNRMVGVQVGIDQSWSSFTRLRFAWGAKAGLFYNTATQTGYLYEGDGNSVPVLLDCHADVALRLYEQAHISLGLIGMSLTEQFQSRFAAQSPESTHQLALLAMQCGFDLTY